MPNTQPFSLTRHAGRVAAAATMLAALSACATSGTTTSAPLTEGQQATIAGTVVRVDTAPWAYDGNAVVTVATDAHGEVAVQLPARWHLCKAPAPVDLQSLQPRERVQAVGTVTAPGELVVCAQPTHRLQRAE